MPRLECNICGRKISVPKCCDQSMLIKDAILCCCSDTCHHQEIPKCCGEQMKYT